MSGVKRYKFKVRYIKDLEEFEEYLELNEEGDYVKYSDYWILKKNFNKLLEHSSEVIKDLEERIDLLNHDIDHLNYLLETG